MSADDDLLLQPGARLIGVDLSGRDLSGIDLSQADLSGANLAGARLVNSTLTGASLHGADLTGAHLLGADLTEADLTDARASGAIFGGAKLDRAVLFNANVDGASLIGASMQRVDFRSVSAVEARMRGATLVEGEFRGSDLSFADLSESVVDEADFSGSSLHGAHLRNVHGYRTARWVGVDISDGDFTNAYAVRRAIMDENYLHEFRNAGRLNTAVYRLWKLTSDCGRSLGRWAVLTLSMAVLFGTIYTQVSLDYGDYETVLSPYYFSVVTLTTLGYGDVLPASLGAQIVVLAEVLTGYIMLGGLLSIFATKMGRRAE